MSAFGVAVLIGAAGCTRTSDGSYVMRKPAMFSRLAMFGDQRKREVNKRRPSTIAPPPAANTQVVPAANTQVAPAAKPQRQAKITGPSLSLIKSPPFKQIGPAKPISCQNRGRQRPNSGRLRLTQSELRVAASCPRHDAALTGGRSLIFSGRSKPEPCPWTRYPVAHPVRGEHLVPHPVPADLDRARLGAAVLQARYNATSDGAWMRAYFTWVKVFALSFALGVVSGVTMSFQFGTNWPGYMQKVGNVAGPLLAYEMLTAFFLEAVFLGIMLFGFRRVSNRVHTLATFLVAFGTTLSAFWILALNSWMQTPAGYEMRDGVAHVAPGGR